MPNSPNVDLNLWMDGGNLQHFTQLFLCEAGTSATHQNVILFDFFCVLSAICWQDEISQKAVLMHWVLNYESGSNAQLVEQLATRNLIQSTSVRKV